MASSGLITPPARAAARTIAQRLDALPATPLHWTILVVAALGLFFDVVEAGLSNALSAVFSAAPYRVLPAQLALLLASVFIGGAIGAPVLGWLADRFGRRGTLAAALLTLTITSLLAAVSADIDWLTVCRILSGLALGAYPPLIVAYLSDVLPPARRGRMLLTGGAIGYLGAPAVVFLVRWLMPLAPFGVDGWRWALLIGAAGSAVVAVAFCWLPESPRWLAARGRLAAADAACKRFEQAARGYPRASIQPDHAAPDAPATFDRRYRLRALLIAALFFLSPWATIGFPLLSGAVLVAKGFHLNDSLLYVGVALFGPSCGVLLASFLIDRVERHITLALSAGAMAVFGIVFGWSTTPLPLMLFGVAFNLVGAIYISVLSIYDGELFPTAMRALISSTTFAVNRLASAIAPLALLALLKGSGQLALFAVIAAAMIASVALLLAFGPREVTRRPVE